MTHATIPPRRARTLGIGDALVRLSVGIEDVDDLRADLRQALARISGPTSSTAGLGPRLSSRGEQPKRARNARLKWAASLKPQEKAISLTLRAAQRRVAQVAPGGVQALRPDPVGPASTASPTHARCSVLGDSRSCAAISATLEARLAQPLAHEALICSRWQRGELRQRRPARRRQRRQARDQDLGHAVGHRHRRFGRQRVDVGGERADHADHQVPGATVAADRRRGEPMGFAQCGAQASGRAA